MDSAVKFSRTLDPDLACLWEFVPEGDGAPGGVEYADVENYGARPYIFRPVKQNGSRLHLRLQTRDGKDARYGETEKYLAGELIERRAYTSDVRRGVYWRKVTGLWTAEYRHPDGRTETAAVTAVSYSGAKVCARNGEHDGFELVRVARRVTA